MRNQLVITTDEEEQHYILVGISYREQENGDKKRIGFEIIRKVPRGIQHNGHKFLRDVIPFDPEEK